MFIFSVGRYKWWLFVSDGRLWRSAWWRSLPRQWFREGYFGSFWKGWTASGRFCDRAMLRVFYVEGMDIKGVMEMYNSESRFFCEWLETVNIRSQISRHGILTFFGKESEPKPLWLPSVLLSGWHVVNGYLISEVPIQICTM